MNYTADYRAVDEHDPYYNFDRRADAAETRLKDATSAAMDAYTDADVSNAISEGMTEKLAQLLKSGAPEAGAEVLRIVAVDAARHVADWLEAVAEDAES